MSVTQGNFIYSSYLEFEEIEHSELSVDDYGLDEITRTYSGMRSLLNGFLARWLSPAGAPLNTADTVYPSMYAMGRPSVSTVRGFSTVSVKFTGKASGQPPLAKIKNKWSDGTVQATGDTSTMPAVTGTAMVDYRALSTSYEYYTPALPTAAVYSGVVGNGVTITTVTSGGDASIAATAHGLIVGDQIIFDGITGTVPDLNGYNTVKAVTDANNFTVDTTLSTGGTGGHVYKVTGSGQGISVTAIRGFVKISDNYYPITTLDPASFVVEQRLKSRDIEQIGRWYKCEETWAWELGQTADVGA